MGQSGRHAMIYGGFEIQSFEAGRGLWHARIQRADQAPVMIDGLAFPTLEVGFAWSNPAAAIADAKPHIDRFKAGFANPLTAERKAKSPYPFPQRPCRRRQRSRTVRTAAPRS